MTCPKLLWQATRLPRASTFSPLSPETLVWNTDNCPLVVNS